MNSTKSDYKKSKDADTLIEDGYKEMPTVFAKTIKELSN